MTLRRVAGAAAWLGIAVGAGAVGAGAQDLAASSRLVIEAGGASSGPAGDVNGDGLTDLVIGVPDDHDLEGDDEIRPARRRMGALRRSRLRRPRAAGARPRIPDRRSPAG